MALVSSLQVDTSATISTSTKSNTEQIKNNNNSVLHMICSAFINVQFMIELYSLVDRSWKKRSFTFRISAKR